MSDLLHISIRKTVSALANFLMSYAGAGSRSRAFRGDLLIMMQKHQLCCLTGSHNSGLMLQAEYVG